MKKKIPIPHEWRMKDTQHGDRCWWWLASLFMAAMLALIATACEPDAIQVQPETPEEGLPATLRIDVNAHEPISAQTRAVNTTAITDLHILVYNGAGELIGQKYTKNLTAPYSITINTRSANNCTVYAIANTANQTLFDGEKVMKEDNLKAATDSITSWDKLTNGTHLVMTGKKTGITIAAGSPESNKIGNISVSRIAAQVTLNLSTNAADNITIHNYRIYGLAKKAYYIIRPTRTEGDANDTGNTSAGDDAAKTSTSVHWINSPLVSVEAANDTTTFYMYENRRGVKTNITTQQNKNKANAPDSAAYVLINGETNGYKYTWRVYLGANNTTNFNMKRNCTYTYNIKLKHGGTTDTRVTITDMFEELVGGNVNCYMVTPGDSVNIPVERANESPIEIEGSVLNPTTQTYYQLFYNTEWKAEVVWQTTPGLVSIRRGIGKGALGKFTVKTKTTAGNAVVAIKSGTNILWSWHIWVTTRGNGNFSNYNGNRTVVFMDRALGATSATPGQLSSCGLMYQWGRKDPFPGIGQTNGSWSVAVGTDPIRIYNASGTLYEFTKAPVPNVTPNNLTNATRNPDTYYYSLVLPNDWFVYSADYTQEDNLWSGYPISLSTAVKKSVFDPCPAGWRIAPWLNNTSPFAGMVNGNPVWANYGRTWTGTGGYFAASGYRFFSTGALHDVSTYGYSWSGTPAGANADYFGFNEWRIYPPEYFGYRSASMPVRCSIE